MTKKVDETITSLMLESLSRARITERAWSNRFQITSARLAKLKSGSATFTDTELDRIGESFEQPWPLVVLRFLGNDSELSKDTEQVLRSLCSPVDNAGGKRRQRPRTTVARR